MSEDVFSENENSFSEVPKEPKANDNMSEDVFSENESVLSVAVACVVHVEFEHENICIRDQIYMYEPLNFSFDFFCENIKKWFPSNDHDMLTFALEKDDNILEISPNSFERNVKNLFDSNKSIKIFLGLKRLQKTVENNLTECAEFFANNVFHEKSASEIFFFSALDCFHTWMEKNVILKGNYV